MLLSLTLGMEDTGLRLLLLLDLQGDGGRGLRGGRRGGDGGGSRAGISTSLATFSFLAGFSSTGLAVASEVAACSIPTTMMPNAWNTAVLTQPANIVLWREPRARRPR